jgi:hypothetical protein
MKTTALVKFGMAALVLVSAAATDAWSAEAAAVRVIPIPREEHGYSNFETTVIASQADLDAFLKKGADGGQMGWNDRAGFEKALADARVDFNRESLVLLRHTEGSGSTRVHFREPQVKGRRVTCRIDTEKAEVGLSVMAYYCFALAVPKAAIDEVEVQVSGRPAVIIPLKNEAAAESKPAF